MGHVAIIGAGLSGLVLAHQLRPYANVTLYEKSRGLGGRLATRYADPYQFDHGAQFFTAKSEAFKQFLQPLLNAGIVSRWDARFVELNRNEITSQRQWGEEYPHYVGMPKMNAIGKFLADGLAIERQTRITSLKRTKNQWQLTDENGEIKGCYDWVITTSPVAQTKALLPAEFAHHDALASIRMKGCFALMLGFSEPLPLPWDAALVRHANVSWVSVNSSKPGRPKGYSLLINSTNDWAEQHLDDDRSNVQATLCREVSEVIGHNVSHADHIALHGWRYANIGRQSGEASLIDEENQLAACGDWCIQGRVEAAFTSALDLAEKLLPQLCHA